MGGGVGGENGVAAGSVSTGYSDLKIHGREREREIAREKRWFSGCDGLLHVLPRSTPRQSADSLRMPRLN